MKKFKIYIKFIRAKIKEIEIEKESDSSIWFSTGRREAKFSTWSEHYNTWDEAYTRLSDISKLRIVSAKKTLFYAEELNKEIIALKNSV